MSGAKVKFRCYFQLSLIIAVVHNLDVERVTLRVFTMIEVDFLNKIEYVRWLLSMMMLKLE